ncbi:sortilin-related receptor-like [Uloborus diversus]|uniref:sortilin-related receptor-like n=1 Tax=Uloborus diversus TaxID=327109 RepID=UPI0024092417|nr:sortilin-related receptor-like [Uloborus diversus]
MRGFSDYKAPIKAARVPKVPFLSMNIFPSKIELFQSCRSSFDCLMFIAHSRCDWTERLCMCEKYHVPFNNTMCLPSSLLGSRCLLDSQCRMKVANSQCVDGMCQCELDHIPLRRDKCIPPARLGEYCLNDRQCQLAGSYTHCKMIIPRIYGKCACPYGYYYNDEGRCLPYLGSFCDKHVDCEEVTSNSFCQRTGKSKAFCECKDGFKKSPNKMKCEPIPTLPPVQLLDAYDNVTIEEVSLGMPCYTTDQCQGSDPNSICKNGKCECIDPDDTCNSKHPGCPKDTFQCRNGQCISWYYVCDKSTSCRDNSDEDVCIKHKCPKEAFQCDDGTCLSRSQVCNDLWECPDGSDEARCYKGIKCDKNAFQCKNGQCKPPYALCNAVQDCDDGSDELDEVCYYGKKCPKEGFLCNNGHCRSTAVLCSGLDGCGDNSDETNCEVCRCKKP